MTTFVIDARAIRKTDENTIELFLSYEDRRVTMTAPLGATLEELALLALAQEFPPKPDQTFQKRVTIEAHQETVTDPGEGDYQIWVVDSVEIAQLPDERAADDFTALTGWATWTGDQAATWIEENVTDLASAKTALIAMARATVALRDWR